MNGDARSTWPNAELHKEIAELRSQLATRVAELENIKFLAEQAEICHQAELAEARNSTPSWIQDHTIEISRLKAELAEAQRENAGCWCKLTGKKILKERDELRTQLAEARRSYQEILDRSVTLRNERDELRAQLTESRSKHLHDVLAEQMLNQELRAAMSAEATEQAAPSTPQETRNPGA